MTVRFHLFPFRTQKLSSLVPKIVRWKRRVKIGSRRLEQNASGFLLRRFLLHFGRDFGTGSFRIGSYSRAAGQEIR